MHVNFKIKNYNGYKITSINGISRLLQKMKKLLFVLTLKQGREEIILKFNGTRIKKQVNNTKHGDIHTNL
jgi:hypothetical protein